MSTRSLHSLLRPGFLVSLKTSVTGGVVYQRTELDPNAEAPEAVQAKADVQSWKTTKIVADSAEHERANEIRGKARSLISRYCVATDFGLLCPTDRETELYAAYTEARRLAAEHNATAGCTEITVRMFTGAFASSDEENARAVGEEIRSLIQGMSGAIDRLDPAAIRDAAEKARLMSTMLAPEQSEKVNAAITAARKAARDIVRRVEKGGEVAAIVLADIQRGAIEQARIAFLDLDGPADTSGSEALPAVDLARTQALDLDTDAAAVAIEPAPRASAPALDIGGDDTLPPPPAPTPTLVAVAIEEHAPRGKAKAKAKGKTAAKIAPRSGVRVKGAA